MTAPDPFFVQLRTRVVQPTLGFLGLDSPAALNLVLGTAAQESGGNYLAQWPCGPALGLWQIEPATRQDVHANFLDGHAELHGKVLRLVAPYPDLDMQLASNLAYAAAICRLIYFRVPEVLPAATDLAGLAGYWKRYFNTPAGGGTTSEFLFNFAKYIGDPING